MRNIALILMYNGTAYHGWQVQKTETTVAQTLERGLSMVCGQPIKCTGCGRTDAGVHAEHYVANFRTDSRIPVDRLPFAVNTHIPEDIVVKAAYEVAEDFNAIGSCIKKEYTYRIYNSRVKNPFYVNRAYFYPKRLDEEVMDRAARMFEGTHDFAAVRSVGTNVRSTVRTIYYCRVRRQGDLSGYNSCNVLSMHALTGAYSHAGMEWVDQLCAVLDKNLRYIRDFMESRFPGVSMMLPQGTYMLFVNCGAWCRDHGITPDQLRRRGVEHGVIWQSGEAFGDGDCIRINAALPHALVQEAMDRLEKYVFV
jgi:tRNA pseudouridine38-40 synthase